MGELLPDSYEPEIIPQVGELDELETFIGSKKTRSGTGCAVDHFKPGILEWVLGDRLIHARGRQKMAMLFLRHRWMEHLVSMNVHRKTHLCQVIHRR